MPSLSICHAGSGTGRGVESGWLGAGRVQGDGAHRMPAVLAVERERPARRGTGATVLLDELLHWRKGAVLGDLGLEEVEEPWLLALRGDDEDVQRADVLALVIRQPSPCHVLLH